MYSRLVHHPCHNRCSWNVGLHSIDRCIEACSFVLRGLQPCIALVRGCRRRQTVVTAVDEEFGLVGGAVGRERAGNFRDTYFGSYSSSEMRRARQS